MTQVFQKRLLRAAACIALMLPIGTAAHAQLVPGGQANAPSLQSQGREGGEGRLNQAPRVEENGMQRRGDQDARAPRRSDGDRRGPGAWNRDGRTSNQVQDASPQGDGVNPRYDGRRDGYRNGYRDGYGDRGGYGRNGWARGGYDGNGPGRYDGDRGRWGYPGYGRNVGAYGPRFPAYRGWGWAHGGYAAPVIIAPAYRGWAYKYPFSTPYVVVSPYRGWAVGPVYPVYRRR